MSYLFDAGGECIDCGTGTLLGASSPWTVSVWVKQSTEVNACVVAKRTAWVTNNEFAVMDSYNQLAFNREDTGGNLDVYFVDNTWKNVIVVATNGTVTGYGNGTAGTPLTGADYRSGPSGGSARICIGRLIDEAGSQFLGRIAEIGIWNRALTSGEIAALAGRDKPSTITSGLVAYWPLYDDANDDSGNGHNGTVTGATADTSDHPAMNSGVTTRPFYAYAQQ